MHFLKRLVRPQKETAEPHNRHSFSLRHSPSDGDHPRGSNNGSRESSHDGSYNSSHASSNDSPSTASKFPKEVLVSIFSFICPHALDESYLSAEESTTGLGCMLCDMRELSRMSLVCSAWHKAAQLLQYKSIRLDSVHYCGLEEELQARRKRGSFFQKQTSPLEVPEHRMRLLYRTFQDNETAASLVQFLKMPYMTREACKQDLARLVSLLPNLRYVDLPDGVYQDDPSCASLKAILYTRCPDLQKMAWVGGSEKNFVDLWMDPPWLSLEVVELTEMKVENRDLVRVLACMPYLEVLKMKSMPWTSDAAFDSTSTDVGLFPALCTFTIEDTASITIQGLCSYLSRQIVAQTLQTLTITNSATLAHLMHHILALATSLTSLTICEQVSRTIPRTDIPLLSSRSLARLRYEITDDNSSTRNLAKPSPSYYAYLSESLLDGGMPSLKALYVREASFHIRLQNDRSIVGASSGWAQKISVFTKGVDQMEWTKYQAYPVANGDLIIKPVYNFPIASRSRFLADGAGASGARRPFLTAPPEGECGRKKEKKRSRQDLWR